jgi:hypothetical protein
MMHIRQVSSLQFHAQLHKHGHPFLLQVNEITFVCTVQPYSFFKAHHTVMEYAIYSILLPMLGSIHSVRTQWQQGALWYCLICLQKLLLRCKQWIHDRHTELQWKWQVSWCNFVMWNWNTCPYVMNNLQLLCTASDNTGRCGHSSTHGKNFCPTFRTIMQNAEGSKYYMW